MTNSLYPSDTGRTVGTEDHGKDFPDEIVKLLALINRTDCAIGATFVIVFYIT